MIMGRMRLILHTVTYLLCAGLVNEALVLLPKAFYSVA